MPRVKTRGYCLRPFGAVIFADVFCVINYSDLLLPLSEFIRQLAESGREGQG